MSGFRHDATILTQCTNHAFETEATVALAIEGVRCEAQLDHAAESLRAEIAQLLRSGANFHQMSIPPEFGHRLFKARLALALLLFTGQRRSDITRLGRQHVRNGRLTFTQHKGRKRNPNS